MLRHSHTTELTAVDKEVKQRNKDFQSKCTQWLKQMMNNSNTKKNIWAFSKNSIPESMIFTSWSWENLKKSWKISLKNKNKLKKGIEARRIPWEVRSKCIFFNIQFEEPTVKRRRERNESSTCWLRWFRRKFLNFVSSRNWKT